MSAPGPVIGEKNPFVTAHLPPKRRKAGLVYTEGERVVRMALDGAWELEALVLDEHFAEKPEGEDLARIARARRCAVQPATAKAMARLSDCETAPPVGLLLRPKLPELRAAHPAPDRVVVLDRIGDPGNAGTLIRCAAAFGFVAVLTDGSVSALSEKMLRATAGACFLPGVLYGGDSAEDLAHHLAGNGYTVYTLEPSGGEDVRKAATTLGPVALVMGSEVAGVDRRVWRGATPVRIPMGDGIESLNVAIAGSIALYEFSRRGAR